MKRIISILLIAAILATAIPFSVFAEDSVAGQSPAGAEQTTSLQGGSSVANALLSASDASGQQGEYFASIAGAELDGKTVNVRFDSTVAGTVVAAIYSDDGLTMLSSANAGFEGSDEAQFFRLDLDTDSVPEYYILKVFLLDENNNALCGNYTDLEHTSAFAEFMAKDVDDFDPELVVNMDNDNSKNFAVVKEGAVVPEHSGTVNTIITNDYENGKYVIGNATDDIKTLKKGDLLNLQYGESDLDAIVAVVSSISVDGDTVTITENTEAGLADYFDYVKIDVDNSAPAYTMNTDDLPEEIEYDGLYYGSTYESFDDENALQPANNLNRKVGIELVDEENTFDPNFVNKFTAKLSVTAKNGSETLSGTMSASDEIYFSITSVEYKLYFDAKLWEEDTVVCNIILSSETKHIIKVELAGKGEVFVPDSLKKAFKAEVPIFAGMSLIACFYPVISLELNGDITSTYVIKKSSGFRYNNIDGLQVVNTEEKKNKVDCNVQVVIKIGIGVEFGLEAGVPVVDCLSLTITLFIEGGLKFIGEADQTAGGETHSCAVCLKGNAYAFVEYGVRCKLKITEHIELGGEISCEMDSELGKAYISVYRGKFSLGLGTCPHIKYRVGITVKDENDKAVSGAEITYNDDNNTKTATTDSEGKVDVYLAAGSKKITAKADGVAGSKTVKVKDKAQDITITVKQTGHSGSDISAEYTTGTLVTFGSYPQTELKDSATLSALNKKSLSWKSYGYYSGDGYWASGSMAPSDYMKYADVTYNGGKYRAVKFTSYRPYLTYNTCSADNSYQDENGYVTDKVYWFKFEPIVWRVLDPGKGLLMTEKLLDSQAFENDWYHKNWYYYYGDKNYEHYASDWAYSSLREWLNGDFYKTAFASSAEKDCVRTTALTTSASGGSEYDADPTKDVVFLLTWDDVMNAGYGFSSSSVSGADTNRIAYGTDYARCQGLGVDSSTGDYWSGASWWRLRTPEYSGCTEYVNNDGYVTSNGDTSYTDGGIRAALNINLQSAISSGALKKAGSAVTPTRVSLSGAAALTPARTSAPVSRQNVGASPAAKTASHDKCVPGNEYVFVCVKDPDSDIFADGNLLYIDQKTAEGDTVEFTYSAGEGKELFFGEFTGEEPADDYTPGDVNGDGDVLANDARLALRASAQLETLDEKQTKAADVDGSGQVLANDARQILRFSAKLQTEFSRA